MNWNDYGTICRDRGALAREVFACITTPAKPGPPPAELLAAHLAYQRELEARGALFLAGPLSDVTGTMMSGAGLIVYAAPDIAAALALAEADPMHRSGQRAFTVQGWRLNEGAPVPGLRLSSRSYDPDC
jgi:uncharacterized protein YciI